MAKATLPINFKDDVMNAGMNGKRRYRMIDNTDGTVSLEDATTYDQVGSNFGAGQINGTNTAVNNSVDKAVVIDNIDDIAANTQTGKVAGALALKELNRDLGGFKFDVIDGVPVYLPRGADTAIPFSAGKTLIATYDIYHWPDQSTGHRIHWESPTYINGVYLDKSLNVSGQCEVKVKNNISIELRMFCGVINGSTATLTLLNNGNNVHSVVGTDNYYKILLSLQTLSPTFSILKNDVLTVITESTIYPTNAGCSIFVEIYKL